MFLYLCMYVFYKSSCSKTGRRESLYENQGLFSGMITSRFYRKIASAVDSFSSTERNLFSKFEMIGGRNKSRQFSDIDLIIVLNERENPSQALKFLKSWIDHMRLSIDFSVIAHSYFLPLAISSNSSRPILHTVIFLNPTHLAESLFSKAIFLHTSILEAPSYSCVREGREASEMLAFEDATKFWVMSELNKLNSTTNTFRRLRAYTLGKWLSPPTCLRSRYYRDLLGFLKDQKKGT